MSDPEGNSFVFQRVLMFPETKGNIRTRGKTKLTGFPRDLKSVKGSGNSTFLQKDQLCYLKRAEKLTFCIHFS